jgi:hypothetical protein
MILLVLLKERTFSDAGPPSCVPAVTADSSPGQGTTN